MATFTNRGINLYRKILMNRIILFFVFGLASFAVNSSSNDIVEKPFSLGLGTYSSVIDFDALGAAKDEFSGAAFTFGYTVSDSFLLRATYFSLEHDDLSAIESTGFDFLAYLGTGLAKQGFKAYIGGGFFKDEWEVFGFSETFNGLQLSGGIGYNWESVSLDFILGIRDPSDYEDFVNNIPPVTNYTATAISTSLLLSFRF